MHPCLNQRLTTRKSWATTKKTPSTVDLFPTSIVYAEMLTSLSAENQVSSKESSKPSQQKRQKTSTPSDTLTSLTETIANTRKDLLDTTTTTGKDATSSVSDGIKDNAKETGKTYTESLRRT